MAQRSDYYRQKQYEYKKKLAELKAELPLYVAPYLEDKELTVQISSVVAYAYDLLTFFHYLVEKNPLCHDMAVRDIPIEILEQLTFSDINEYQLYLKLSENHQNEEKGIARRMTPLRGFFSYAYIHGDLKQNPTVGAANRKKKIKDAIVRMDSEEVEDFLTSVKNTDIASERQRKFCQKAQMRDIAICTLLLYTGIRVSECVGIDLDDLNFTSNAVRIVRKGGSSSVVYFNETVAGVLQDYIQKERALLLGDDSDEKALFLSSRKQRMCVKAVENVVKKYAKESVPLKKITPHKLRSTFGTSLYQSTGDIYLVADVLGHKDVNTTSQNYSAQEDSHRRQAAHVDIYKENNN